MYLSFTCTGNYLRDTIFTALSCQMGATAMVLGVSSPPMSNGSLVVQHTCCTFITRCLRVQLALHGSCFGPVAVSAQYCTLRTCLTIIAFTRMPEARTTQQWVGLAILYPFFVGLVLGCISLLQAIFYKFVTWSFANLEDAVEDFENRKDDLAQATRATLIAGKTVRTRMLVDKAFLNNRRGVIVATPDLYGKVTVLVDGKYELQLEEFQIAPDVSEEELENKKTFVLLKTGPMAEYRK